jgi:hypothetical protein
MPAKSGKGNPRPLRELLLSEAGSTAGLVNRWIFKSDVGSPFERLNEWDRRNAACIDAPIRVCSVLSQIKLNQFAEFRCKMTGCLPTREVTD